MDRRLAGAFVFAAVVLAGCWDDDDPVQPEPPVVRELPPAGTSRIALIERDDDLDGQPEERTRYGYDDRGWPLSMQVFPVYGGVEEPVPDLEVRREYDASGRLSKLTREGPSLDTNAVEATYGPTGYLESTTASAPGFSVVTRYRWDGDRLTGCEIADSPPESCMVSQDAGGRVASVEHLRAGELVQRDQYVWRDDGSLASAKNDYIEADVLDTSLSYDANGRLTELRRTSDGFPKLWLRYLFDDRGRPVTVERGELPSYFDDGTPFVVTSRYRIVWEDQPCQPVYELQVPPSVDLSVTGRASAAGATLLCAGP
jgi:hypothetical protein